MNDRRSRFDARVLPHLDAAYNLARWLARPPLDADDIVQEAMLRALKGFDSLRGDNVRAWLFSIVRNCFLDAVQKTRRRRIEPLPSDDELEADDFVWAIDESDPEAVMIRTGELRQLHEVVATLPREFQEVLLLREMEDLSYREIGRIAGVPIGTVMSRLARARSMLREKWNGDAKRPDHVVQ
ncbi:MAG TPA: sigma-70 family RNA polymerase sigma factor [Rhizomicrobium sp.]|nr:sigma-70 family RNA polymerase sigma factor [Rhizomicrobium sp.]